MADLTTLVSVKQLVGITAATFDAVLATPFSQVSEQVKIRCAPVSPSVLATIGGTDSPFICAGSI